MTLFQAVAGIGGGVAMGLVAYFTWKILEHLNDHRDIALTMFFLEPHSGRTFEILSLSLLVLSVSSGLQIISQVYDIRLLIAITQIVDVAMMATFAVVYWRFADITRKPSEKYTEM